MITPRRTRLVHAPDLHSFRRAIAALVDSASHKCLVIVPTTAAAIELRRTLKVGHDAGLDVVTRDGFYDRVANCLAHPPRRLNRFERDSLMHAAALAAASEVSGLGFRIRPGLVAEVIRFYDTLRRQGQKVDRFEELLDQAIGGKDGVDRGAERMRDVTRWLALTFRDYERRVPATGAVDEHALRELAIRGPIPHPLTDVVVTVADWVAEPDGLYVADFDLLTRLPGLERLDLVTTEGLLASGFHERLHNWLPEIEELPASELIGTPTHERPRLLIPAGGSPTHWFTCRDRHEELATIARRVKADRRKNGPTASRLERTAVVFKRPLPYLYLANDTLAAAGVPFTSTASLPLAAEPFAAAVDLILDAVESGFTRTAIVSLIRSPHVAERVSGAAAAALDRALSKARYLGDIERLAALNDGWEASPPRGLDAACPALTVALGFARELAPLAEPAPASHQVARLLAFITARAAVLADDDPWGRREHRARAAVVETLQSLASAHASHHDPLWTIEDLAPAVRRWIEDRTFEPDRADAGIRLIDDRSARYGDYDSLTIVGLVDQDWPEAPRRNIFYPPALLKALGWPSERDWRSAEDARLQDLVTSPTRDAAASTITLDDERLMMRSVQLDDLHRMGLSTVPIHPNENVRIFADEALAVGEPALDVLSEEARGWGRLRLERPAVTDNAFHGYIGPRDSKKWSVSALETYLACPFKFFAQHVLRLEEEPDDEEVMDPRRQGQFVHGVFEAFFRAWQAQEGGTVTSANLDRARKLFVDVVDRALTHLPAGEAEVERTRLLGSAAAAGLGEAVLRMEAERDVTVVERLLEHRLEGEFTIVAASGPRRVSLNGKSDRIDLLADGTFRLIDYKLGWPPSRTRVLQLGVYGLCAEQKLAGYRGRSWTLCEAVYLAFKGPRRVVPLFASPSDKDHALADAQVRLADTIDAVERGEFPPTPDDVFLCETCSFVSVCRKDYVGDV